MPPLSRPERNLQRLLTSGGFICALALVAVVMPRSWHVQIHAGLGLGDFPEAPIAEYLARGMSAMCGLFGLLQMAFARDVRAYAPLITFQAISLTLISLFATAALWPVEMPRWWLLGDVLSVCGYCLAILALQRAGRVPSTEPHLPAHAHPELRQE
jgi:hypothetical protein